MQNNRTPYLIALIGIDAAGKSTQLHRLADFYLRKGLRVATTALEEKPTINNIFKLALQLDSMPKKFPFGLSADYFAFALYCDFFNHYCKNVLPLLRSDYDLLISDRYLVCYEAYAQSVGAVCEFSRSPLKGIVQEADLEIYFDVDVTTALERATSRPKGKSLDETQDMLNKLIAVYIPYSRNQTNVEVIDARKAVDDVTAAIVKAIDRRLL